MYKVKPTFVDLFCGCGGFGLGAELAGFRSLASVDIDKNLQHSYKLNFPQAKVILGDVSTLDESFWNETIGFERPDAVIGGPPCQGFSRIGLRQPEDPRNSLVAHFFRQIKILKPKFFIMENVEGILDARNESVLKAAIELVESSYTIIGPFKINALDCGAATSRKRVVVVGYDPSCVLPPSLIKLISPSEQPVTVRDAISDIPSPTDKSKILDSGYEWASIKKKTFELSPYATVLNSKFPEGLGADFALQKLKDGFITGVMRTVHTEAVIQRFKSTLPGMVETVSRYPRLSWEGHCPTLRAGTGSDKGSFQAMRPIHPSEPRVITVREAARLQGFPDWFLFHPTIWHSFRMIGNSVSPVMAKYLMGLMKECLVGFPKGKE
jgi:DNA (cytosine-5)-methyltransferase 1